MVAIVGRHQVHYTERIKHLRNRPRVVRPHARLDANNTLVQIANSFTKHDYTLYEELIFKYGTPGRKACVMFEECSKIQGLSGKILQLTKLRATDLNSHQKVVQMLRYRWSNQVESRANRVNSLEDVFWNRMAGSIQHRCKNNNYSLYKHWQGTDGKAKLASFLKKKFEFQHSKCAMSGELLELKVGSGYTNLNKASPDRINSNRGYYPNNLWLVTSWVNTMKLDLPLETFRSKIHILANSLREN